jgi:membrane protein YqaA with SNARE-associated domain
VTEFGDITKITVLLFAAIFVLNLLPAFAPPTWMAMSFIGLTVPNIDFVSLAVVAATAATLGRIALAKLSRVLVRQRLLSEQTQLNIDAIKQGIEARPVMSFGTFLAYSFSPLPSNYLFIAYGLTSLSIAFLALPFFIGRLASYAFWIRTASAIGDRFDLDWFDSSAYFIIYFIVSQLLLIPIIYGFTRIDWHAVLAGRGFKWLR